MQPVHPLRSNEQHLNNRALVKLPGRMTMLLGKATMRSEKMMT